MLDQSFNILSVQSVLRKSDFYRHPYLFDDDLKAAAIRDAVGLANGTFAASNPLEAISVRGRIVHRPKGLTQTLIIRKLYVNLRSAIPSRLPGRRYILGNVRSLLGEGVPYRVYKADVRKFYDSFMTEQIFEKIASLQVSDFTKKLTISILEHYQAAGHSGLPLGLNLSSVLSEMLMADFDKFIRTHPAVHYYARYVDDLVIFTNGQERQVGFQAEVSAKLPAGLELGRRKSYCREALHGTCSPFDINFLGYHFSVSTGNAQSLKTVGRHVATDVSAGKVKKIKTCISRSLISYAKSRDFALLEKRLQFLTSNLSLPKAGSSVRQLIGLSNMYPDLDAGSPALAGLDTFLRSAIISSQGRSFSQYNLTRRQKNRLLRYSFVRGYEKNKFFYFSHKTVEDIQRCWSLEN